MPRALALDPVARPHRVSRPALDVQDVWVQSSYGFSGDLGGGPYDRSAAVRAANQSVAIDLSAAGDAGGFFDAGVWQVGVSHLLPDDGSGTLFPSLRDAVEAWNLQPRRPHRRDRADGQPDRRRRAPAAPRRRSRSRSASARSS